MSAVDLPVDRLLYASHDMAFVHIDRWRAVPAERRPPIEVEELPGGWWFVHDGRHRAEARRRDGARTIPALIIARRVVPADAEAA